MTKTHLIADKSLGGLLREYVETDRKASVGDYVWLVHTECEMKVDGSVDIYDINTEIKFGNIKTLAPTEIVVIAEEIVLDDTKHTKTTATQRTRYKLADRKAAVGEKVVAISKADGGWYDDKIGEVFTVISGLSLGFDDEPEDGDAYVDHPENNRGSICYISREMYRVLEPTDTMPKQTPLVELTTANASEQVIEMLANLSRRIVEIEKDLNAYKALGINEHLREGNTAIENKLRRMSDEIDTLHRNNVKLAEELANHKAAEQAPAETTEVDAVDFNAFTDAVVERVAAKLLGGGKR